MWVCHALRPGVIKLSLGTSRRPTVEERLRIESVNCVTALARYTQGGQEDIWSPVVCVCVCVISC